MRRPLVIAAALALVLAVAGCGGGETVQPLPETVSGEIPQQGTGTDGGEGDGEATTTLPEEGSAEAGLAVFEEQGCGSCHVFEPAQSEGTTGPNLTDSLQNKDQEYILEAIVNPDAEITEGYPPGLMPQDYGEKLDSTQLANLVAFLTPQL